ncbi:MAG: class I SAM-dependent methyltransferase [Candidatus Zixiibacteriota bacterium]|nr:MAG: class I SAM-dependent methyltransferase [candidate division Zixibacteria bacterium]
MFTEPYARFAEVYDSMGADDFSIKMTEYCRKIFRRFKINPCTGLDICCGTGTAIKKFSELGIHMCGLDRSAAMLAVAAKKLKGHRVTLYQKPLPRFRIIDALDSRKTRRFDLVTCFFDSLNYLKNQRELGQAFKSIYIHLNSGGYFIFDMNTPAAMKILWGGQVFVKSSPNLFTVWHNEYYPKTKSAKCTATFFKKKGTTWERFDEEHLERAYDNRTIKKTLRDSGLVVKGFYRCLSFEKPAKGTYRICGVAKRPV